MLVLFFFPILEFLFHRQMGFFFLFSFSFLFFGNISGVLIVLETNTRGIKKFKTKMMNSLYDYIYTLIDWVVLKYHLNDTIL